MIEPEDIRVGNYFNLLGTRRQVIGLSKQNSGKELSLHYAEFKGTLPFKLMHLKGIEITEPLMIDLGFKQLDKYSFTKDGLFVYHRKRGFVTGSKKREIKLIYVHELQNWFYINSNKKKLELC